MIPIEHKYRAIIRKFRNQVVFLNYHSLFFIDFEQVYISRWENVIIGIVTVKVPFKTNKTL
jgi:hypothetical protein